MGVRIGDFSSRLELLSWTEATDKRRRLVFLNLAEAERFVQDLMPSVEAFAMVRHWGAERGYAAPTDRGFVKLVAAALMTGELWIGEQERDLSRLGGGRPAPIPPQPGPGPRPGPGPKPKPVAHLVVTVRDLNGKPVEAAVVTAKGLGVKETGKDGVADFGKVVPGTYDISAAKPGHGKVRNGIEERDEKKAVSVPDGDKTEVALIQHPECANVAFFEGSKIPAHYFGFDHKTNMKATDAYWAPLPARGSLSLPADRMKRDDARWVSVAVGAEAELEIHYIFDGADCLPCLANCTFEIVPSTVAEVVTAHITTKHSWFKIKGLARGEASLKVVCDGHDIGWFHIWCEVPKTLPIDVATIVTSRTNAATYDLAALKVFLDDIFKQAAVTLDLRDLGQIDMSADLAVAAAEAPGYPPGKMFLEDASNNVIVSCLTALDLSARLYAAVRTTGPMPRPGARRLYFYVPKVGRGFNGMAIAIGDPATFVFYDTAPGFYSTAAHELGHSMKLDHPTGALAPQQFRDFHLATLNQPVAAFPATNTEPGFPAHAADTTVMASDPLNLMGYWHDRAARKYLRYHQWKALDRS